MDKETGRVYATYAEAESALKAKGLTDAQIKQRLQVISGKEYYEYKGMNRHDRRKAAKMIRIKRHKNVE